MKYPDFELNYDNFMADSYRHCIAFDWSFPEEVLAWFERWEARYVLTGLPPIKAEGEVVRRFRLPQVPWSHWHLKGGINRWGKRKSTTPTPAPENTLSLVLTINGDAQHVDLPPGEQIDVSTGHGTRISVRNCSNH